MKQITNKNTLEIIRQIINFFILIRGDEKNNDFLCIEKAEILDYDGEEGAIGDALVTCIFDELDIRKKTSPVTKKYRKNCCVSNQMIQIFSNAVNWID